MEYELEPIVKDGALSGTLPDEGRAPRRRRRLVSLISAAAVLGLAVGAVVVLVSGGPAGPDEQLAALRGFVGEAKTAHFTADVESVTTPRRGETGSGFSSRTRSEGDLVLPDQGRWRMDGGDGLESEMIATAQGVYFRYASEPGSDLDSEPWAYTAHESAGPFGPPPVGAVPPPTGAGLMGGFATAGIGFPWLGPGGLEEVLDKLESPEQVAPDVIRVHLPLDDLWSPDEFVPDLAALEGFPFPEGTVTVELTSGAGGRLERILWRVESTQEGMETSIAEDGTETSTRQMDSSVETTDVRFSHWDELVDLNPPAPADVDPTPGIDEEALASFDKFSVPVPRDLPDGFYLVSASVIDGEFYAGEDPLGIGAPVLCPSVNLSWGQTFENLDLSDPAQLPVPQNLSLYVGGTTCGGVGTMPLPGPGQARPFVAGRHRGTIREEPMPGPDNGAGFRTVSLVVNGAQLEFSSSLTAEELSSILADLVPFDVANQNIYRQEPPTG